MEIVLAFCAIVCACVFGLGLRILQKKQVPKKPWGVVFKIFIQLTGVASFFCTFFSLYAERSLLREGSPWWCLVVFSAVIVSLLALAGNMLPDIYEKITQLRKNGFKKADNDFLWLSFVVFMMILTGSLTVGYLLGSIPIMMYPVMVILMGALFCGAAAIALMVCYGIFRLIFYLLTRFLTDFKRLCRAYWKWLTE